jgi:hypothetical protein
MEQEILNKLRNIEAKLERIEQLLTHPTPDQINRNIIALANRLK